MMGFARYFLHYPQCVCLGGLQLAVADVSTHASFRQRRDMVMMAGV
jgi:hypothetical protein